MARWRKLFTFPGILGWKELNTAIAHETGNDEPFFEDEERFQYSVRSGWVTYRNRNTIVWEYAE